METFEFETANLRQGLTLNQHLSFLNSVPWQAWEWPVDLLWFRAKVFAPLLGTDRDSGLRVLGIKTKIQIGQKNNRNMTRMHKLTHHTK
jgi:hypothetical protein